MEEDSPSSPGMADEGVLQSESNSSASSPTNNNAWTNQTPKIEKKYTRLNKQTIPQPGWGLYEGVDLRNNCFGYNV